ncbi:hypothetical protein PG993_011984 [Apiospora rasikravindrae]|uniref:Uncharacterized protein n=1 Tax=Apiospora rasikravindrae TaxID=990691 RepID=A0ABR1S1N1_9PEZI
MISAGRSSGTSHNTKRRSSAPQVSEYVHYTATATPDRLSPSGDAASGYGICFRKFEDDEDNNHKSQLAWGRPDSTKVFEPREFGLPDTWIDAIAGNDGQECEGNDYENIQLANQWMDDIDGMWQPTLQHWDRGAWTSQQGTPEPVEARFAHHSPASVLGAAAASVTVAAGDSNDDRMARLTLVFRGLAIRWVACYRGGPPGPARCL